MTLGQLRTFLAVVAAGSVRGAAERLYVTQPAVSSAIASLQEEVGVALFVRDGRGVRVTAAGQVFAAYAQRLLGLAEESVVAAKGEADPHTGTLRVAAVTTAGEHVLPSFLATFRRDNPGVGLVLEVGNRTRVWQLLDQHTVDIAIGGRPAGRRFRSLATRPNLLTMVTRPDDVGDASDLDSLARATWLLREEGSGTRTTAEELFDDLGIAPPTLTVGSNGAIRESVRAGLGMTLISRDAVTRELDDGTLVELRYGPVPLRRSWHVVARAGEELPGTARLFLDHLLSPERPSPFAPSPR